MDSMPNLPQFSALVATLYEAAADPRQWPRFVDDFYTMMNATRGCLTSRACDPELASVVLQGYTEPEVRAYSDYFWKHDIVLEAGLQTMTERPQWIGDLAEILPTRELEASEIYNDYYRSLKMHHSACMMVGVTGPYAALGLSVWRPRSSGAFSLDEIRLLELLEPHLRQAFLLQARLTGLRSQATTFEQALKAASVAVIALRSDGRILATSEAAEAALKRGESLLRRGSRLHAVNPEKDRSLQHLIHGAILAGQVALDELNDNLPQRKTSLLLPQSGKTRGLQVQVLPARPAGVLSAVPLAALIFIADPGQVPATRAQTLRDLYRLSPLEARLADLFLQGLELKQAADELRLTYENVRFHLKQIFRKTNTSRQTELLRLLLTIPA